MNIILEKNGQQIEYRAGNALYLLVAFIPYIGGLISLVLQFKNKHIKGIFLNQLIIAAAAVVAMIVVLIISSTTGVDSALGQILAIILVMLMIAFAILSIWMTVAYILNANYYAIKQRLAEGYSVVNEQDATVALAVQKAEQIKVPFWQITKF